ncbi:prepilin-type N-terminal cleavage/methylation domain-containing protein [bacterium]|nr:prepilin-type N-terminal cleavage/methylation domain-containing protein [bacterium]
MNIYSNFNVFVKRQENIKSKTLFGLKNKSISGRTGFTLVEMMVAVIILSIFIVAVGMMLSSSWRFWNDGWQQVILQRDASYAFASVEKVVRSGSSATILDGGTGLEVIKDGTSGWTKNFQSGGGVLQLVEGSQTKDIISRVQSINFSISGNTVLVTLTLTDGSSVVDFRTTIFLRNVS